MKLKILAVVVLGAVGVGAAVYAMGGISANAAAATRYLTSAATTGDVTDEVAATGSVGRDHDLRPRLRGDAPPVRRDGQRCWNRDVDGQGGQRQGR